MHISLYLGEIVHLCLANGRLRHPVPKDVSRVHFCKSEISSMARQNKTKEGNRRWHAAKGEEKTEAFQCLLNSLGTELWREHPTLSLSFTTKKRIGWDARKRKVKSRSNSCAKDSVLWKRQKCTDSQHTQLESKFSLRLERKTE